MAPEVELEESIQNFACQLLQEYAEVEEQILVGADGEREAVLPQELLAHATAKYALVHNFIAYHLEILNEAMESEHPALPELVLKAGTIAKVHSLLVSKWLYFTSTFLIC